jgi:superfamily I DNA and/or RNA helicase
MEKILQTYLRRLTNLSGNNRSLLLLRIVAEHFIDVHAFDFLNNSPSFEVIHQLIAGRSTIKLCSGVDPRDARNNEVSSRLKKLQRIDKFIFEERGSKDLHVGWPFLRGRFSDGMLVRAPLLFFPVEIILKENDWFLQLRKDVTLTFNKTLLLAYAYYNQVSLEEDLIEKVFDDFDRESKSFRTALYKLLKDSPVEINFNPEIFVDLLMPFENFKKEDFANRHGNGELKLYPEAVLGIFPQAGSYLVPDYVHLIREDKYRDFEHFFSERSYAEDEVEEKKHLSFFYFLNKIKEEHTFTSFKMDAFQENALKAVKKGNSIVVQGPPGTGKSQLICNLISDFIARKKRVLVVCQKRAALDVVYERLKQEEISDFAALVHDFKNDRKQIYAQISSQINSLYKYRLKNNSLDAIHLERRFLQSSRQIDRLTEELEELKFALFDEKECGLSVKELYMTSDPNKPFINLKQEYNYFKFNDLQPFLTKLNYYILAAKRFMKEGYPWHVRKNFKDHSLTDLKGIISLIEEIPGFMEELDRNTMELIGSKVSLYEAELILKKRKAISTMFEILADQEVYREFQFILSSNPDKADYLYLSNLEKNITRCFGDEGLEASLPVEELGKLQVALHRMFRARKNMLRWLGWLAFSRDRPWIKRVLDENQLKTKLNDLKTLTRKLDNRLNFEHNITKLKSNDWIREVPGMPDLQPILRWFDTLKKAVKAKDLFISARNFPQYFNVSGMDYTQLKNSIERLLELLKEVPGKKMAWETYLLPIQIEDIINGKYDRSKLTYTLNRDFEDLCEFDRLQHDFYDYERYAISKLDPVMDSHSSQEIQALFDNSLRMAWIEHIETKYPVLRVVSSLKMESMIRELQEAVKEKLKVSREIILMKCRERTYEGVEYNRFKNMTTYRELSHQVMKKRKIWPIRRLVSHFSAELFNLIPCWMTSPESVSAIFPMEKMFDLVIFDEASQCFTERGIPAMYRGKQIVVAGDAQQLSPFDLYKVRWDNEPEEDVPELEADSLLDLTGQYLMQVQLRGHYRSKSMDLIDFSNQHFYGGNLSILPDRKLLNRKEPAINFQVVEGIWEKSCNEIEAKYVAELVLDLIKKNDSGDIGVVAFNARQQDLILDLIEQRAAEQEISLPESLFVKNIENVQGDERDIIIFSLTHGPDKKGKLAMQFGSLNVIKGENRLNVAVTRAREKIYLISSFRPHQMKTEHLRNEGLKMLKRYLEYADLVSGGKFSPAPKIPVKSNADWYLKNRIREDLSKNRKFRMEISEEMPFADLTLKTEEDYHGVILTDDDLYFQNVSSKEAHVYNPFTLAMKNWKFRGVFSREYWQDKNQVINRLIIFSNHL